MKRNVKRNYEGAPSWPWIIPLTQGKFALVDENDYAFIVQYNWCAFEGKTGKWYAYRRISKGKCQFMHQFLFPNAKLIDHKNGCGLDNRRNNLRSATKSNNAGNGSKHHDNTSGFKGVTTNNQSGRYYARLLFDGKRISVGTYSTPEEAAHAYDKAAKEYFGEYARLNFPEGE